MKPAALSRLGVMFAGLASIVAILPNLLWMPAWVSVVVLLALAWRLLLEGANGLPKPPAWVRMLITVGVVVYVFFEFRTLLGRQAGITLLTLMLALKFLESSSRRDALLVVTLSYFVTACQGLISQSLGLTAYMVLAVVVITLCLRVLNAPAQRSDMRLGATANAGSSLRRILLALLIPLLHALPLALIFFLFVPRLGTPVFGVPEDAIEARTGLSDEMAPGSVSKLYIDDSPVMRVRFEGTPPAQSDMYWRGPVLWNFDGSKWTASFGYSRMPAKLDGLTRAATTFSYEVTLEPTDRNWLFALDVATTAPEGAAITQDFQLVQRKPVTALKRYRQSSDATLLSRIEDSRASVMALTQPADRNPRTQELAQSWRAENPDAQALVDRAMRHFREEAFFYTLEPQTLGGNPVDDFLFSTREGYCEHYASAFTSLMRAAGVPARVVTGYQGGYKNPGGDFWVVRQSDAHAWSEVFISGRGWVRVDPTAAVSPDRINRGTDAALRPDRYENFPWLRDLRDRLDRISDVWNRSVLTFNDARQRALLEPFGVAEMDWRFSASALTIGLLGTALLVLLTLWWFHRPAPIDPLAAELRRFRTALKQRGLAAGPELGPSELIELLSGHFQETPSAALAFLRGVNLARYANQRADPSQTGLIRRMNTRALRQIRRLPLKLSA